MLYWRSDEYLTIFIFLEIQKECEKVQPQQGVFIWANTYNSEQSLYKKNRCYGYLNKDKRE